MSQENVALLERATAALNAGALTDELAAEMLAPDYSIENAATAVTDKTYYGAEGVREWVRDIFEGMDEDSRYETEEITAEIGRWFTDCEAVRRTASWRCRSSRRLWRGCASVMRTLGPRWRRSIWPRRVCW